MTAGQVAEVAPATLEVRDLSVHFTSRAGVVRAVDNVSFSVGAGRILGLAGESGSGKSVTGLSIMRLIDPPGRIVGGRILFHGRDLMQLPEREMRALRGSRIAMVFQDPMMTLNPVITVGAHMMETVRAHVRVGRGEARSRSIEALAMAGIPSPAERFDAYPHEFSGGMRQRVAIAIAFLHRPELIIADEPTTALDVTIQSQILAEMQKLAQQRGTALIWVSHDLTVLSGLADDIAVMYAGRIAESGTVEEVLNQPAHPYTRGLMDSVPSRNVPGQRIRQIPGVTPSPLNLGPGCAFRGRCFAATTDCTVDPPPMTLRPGHILKCYHPQLVASS